MWRHCRVSTSKHLTDRHMTLGTGPWQPSKSLHTVRQVAPYIRRSSGLAGGPAASISKPQLPENPMTLDRELLDSGATLERTMTLARTARPAERKFRSGGRGRLTRRLREGDRIPPPRHAPLCPGDLRQRPDPGMLDRPPARGRHRRGGQSRPRLCKSPTWIKSLGRDAADLTEIDVGICRPSITPEPRSSLVAQGYACLDRGAVGLLR